MMTIVRQRNNSNNESQVFEAYHFKFYSLNKSKEVHNIFEFWSQLSYPGHQATCSGSADVRHSNMKYTLQLQLGSILFEGLQTRSLQSYGIIRFNNKRNRMGKKDLSVPWDTNEFISCKYRILFEFYYSSIKMIWCNTWLCLGKPTIIISNQLFTVIVHSLSLAI